MPRRGGMGRTGKDGKKGDKGEKGDTVVGPAGDTGPAGQDATANWILKADPPNTVVIGNGDTAGILGDGTFIQTILSGQNVIISPVPGAFMSSWNLEANNVSPVAIVNSDIVSFNGIGGIAVSRSGKNIIIDGTAIAPSSLIVQESDGAPSVSGVNKINFDQANGFVLTNNGGGEVTVNYSTNLWKTFTADTGTTTANTPTDTFSIVGLNGITTSITGDTLIIDGSGLTPSALTVRESDTNPTISAVNKITFDSTKFVVTNPNLGEAFISLVAQSFMTSWTAADNAITTNVTDGETVKWKGAGNISVTLDIPSQTFTIDGTNVIGSYNWKVAEQGISTGQGPFTINSGKQLTFAEGNNIGLNLVEVGAGTGNYSLTITNTATPAGTYSWTLQDETLSETISNSETVKFLGAGGITAVMTSASPAIITISGAGVVGTYTWKIAASDTGGVGTVNSTNTVNLISGTNMTITRSGNDITFDATGGGSGIGILDEGVIVPGAFTSLNFVGATVTATDAGGGQANITITAGAAGMNTWNFLGSETGSSTQTVTDGDTVAFNGFNGITVTSLGAIQAKFELGSIASGGSMSQFSAPRYINSNQKGLAITRNYTSSGNQAVTNDSLLLGGASHVFVSNATRSAIIGGFGNEMGPVTATANNPLNCIILGGVALKITSAVGAGAATNCFALAGDTNSVGALCVNSGTIGGNQLSIGLGISNTVIIGGNIISATQGNMVYVPALIIKGVANDPAVTKLMVWDDSSPGSGTPGIVKYRLVSSLAAGFGALTDARQGLIKNTDGLPTPTYWVELGNPTFDDTPTDEFQGRVTNDRWINLKNNNIAFVAKGATFLAPNIDSSAENNFMAGGVSHNIDGVNARENLLFGRQSHVTGSERCLVGGTESSSSASAENCISIGYQCNVEDLNTTAIGKGNLSSAPQAISTGESCTSSKDNTFTGGKLAKASRLAQFSRSSGLDGVAAQGYSQRSGIELFVRTTTISPTNLKISGSDNIGIPQDTIVQFKIMVTAAASTGSPRVIQRGASWYIEGTIVNSSGTTAFISATHLPLYHVRITAGTTLSATTTDAGKPRDFSDATAGGWRLNLIADNATDELVLQAIGDNTNDIAWQATVTLNEIKLPS